MVLHMANHRNLRSLQLAVWIAWLLWVSLVVTEVIDQPSCSAEGQCEANPEAQAAVEDAQPHSMQETFPSSNMAISITGRRLQELLSGLSNHTGNNGSLVTLFYLADCPHSRALKPVYECLPAFFPTEVPFVSVPHSEMSLMSLMTHGIHALPVLQVNARGRKYRYSGKHWLAPMLSFVSKALGVEPLASVDVAMLCSNQSQLLATDTISSTASNTEASKPNTSTKEQQQQQQQPVCGRWSCARWDGEATAEELTATQHGPMFYAAVLFLVLRLIWWLWSRLTRKRLAVGQSSQATQAPAAAVPTSADTAGSRRDSPGEEAAGQETAVAGKAVSMHVQDHQGVAAVHL